MTLQELEAIRGRLSYSNQAWARALGVEPSAYYNWKRKGDNWVVPKSVAILASLVDMGIITVGDLRDNGLI